MDTFTNEMKINSSNAIIGDNNSNVNFYNVDMKLVTENANLKAENEKLKGLLRLAISQLKIKDRIIQTFIF